MRRGVQSWGACGSPACAGIDPAGRAGGSARARLPRVRGDRPYTVQSLAERVREEAAHDGLAVSQWIAEAVERKVRDAAAREALRLYEEEFGEITDEEMRELTPEWPD